MSLESGGRLLGVDMARGLALLGMTMVHVHIAGPNGEQPGPLTQSILGVPAGLASVLFFIISGVSLSVIAAKGSSSADPDALRRRGTVLLIFGLLLSASVWPFSILEHYGVMFLVAPAVQRASNRGLTAMTALSLIGGPVLLLGARYLTDDVANYLSAGVLEWLLNWSWSLLVSGGFPLIVWFGFFALGLRLGRLNLRSTQTNYRLLGASLTSLATLWIGLALANAAGLDYQPPANSKSASLSAGTASIEAYASEGGLTVRDLVIDDDPRQLLSTTAHSNQIAWTIHAASIASAILGLSLLLPAAAQRVLRPLSALGSISLTAYLLHLFLVLDGWHYYPLDASVNEELAALVCFEVILLLVSWGIVARWQTGPAERLLKFLAAR